MEFSPPKFTHVHEEDEWLVNMISAVVIGLRHPKKIVNTWSVDASNSDYYSLQFNFLLDAISGVSQTDMTLVQRCSVPRIREVFVSLNGGLCMTVQVFKTGAPIDTNREQIIHIVSQSTGAATDGSQKRARSAPEN